MFGKACVKGAARDGLSANPGLADVSLSNRPFGIKHFQTVHYSVDVARGLALHPSSREGHHSTVRWSSSVLLSGLILHRSHAAATSLVQRNSVPLTQMRCMITASRRARVTMAFFRPRRLAIFIAQALSQDYFVERTSRI